MPYEPISLPELDSLVAQELTECSEEQRRFFRSVQIRPVKWSLSPWGDESGGFWAVAVCEDRVLWYNDIEEGFNVSRFDVAGRIPEDEYWCNDDPIRWALPLLRGEPGTRLGAPQPIPSSDAEEGPTIIFRAADGRALTIAEMRRLGGTFQYEILGRNSVPARAESLHNQARQAGYAGEFQEAIDLLQRASSLAPAWPYPVYDLAFTYLLMKDSDNARRYYQETLQLAPRGFFTAITALDTLDRESKGDLPEGTYLAYLALETLNDPGEKSDAVRRLVELVPGFAPAWKDLASLADSDAERMTATEKGLAANPDRETKGLLLVNKALIMHRSGDHDGAVRLLGELALDPDSTYGTEHMARTTLAILAEQSM